jgi:hypothetical protein
VKNLFKGAAISASTHPGPLYDFYVALLEKGMRPTMARLTLDLETKIFSPSGRGGNFFLDIPFYRTH